MPAENSRGSIAKKEVHPLNWKEMIIIPLVIGVISFALAKLLSFLF